MAKKPEQRFDITGLKVIQQSLNQIKDKNYEVQVGIFGSKDSRPKDKKPGLTNAEIGFIQEMGSVSRHIPRRSFLWDTFTLHGKDMLPQLKQPLMTLFQKGKVEEYLKVVGIAATNLVVEAFQTSGWGAWPQNAYSTIMRKLGRKVTNIFKRRQMAAQVMYEGASHTKPLIDSGQLWQSISSRTAKA